MKTKKICFKRSDAAKRIFVLLIYAAFCFLLLAGCGSKIVPVRQSNKAGTLSVNASAASEPQDSQAASITHAALPPSSGLSEILEIKEKMFIAYINDIYLNPGDYIGKTIKFEGLFKTEYYEDINKYYRFVMRYGPGCCGSDGNAGFEVSWDQSSQDIVTPAVDDWVEAVGTVSLYEEDGYSFLNVAISSLTVKDERGSEYVYQ
jgi:uncharacterized membrane protein YcgQ (UPF0703/DUF1980 family)